MQSLSLLLPFLAALPASIAAPSMLTARSSTCDQYNPIQAGSYAVQNDAWGQDSGSGSQCSQIDGQNGGGVSWSTSFTWSGGENNIKTYANAESSANTPCKPLSQYNSIPTTWSWSYSTDIVGDVSYDAFLGDGSCGGPGAKHTYEIMVWLAKLGSLDPIGTPGATAQIGGSSFTLWTGPNTQTGATVFSFVAAQTINNFQGDLMDFFKYLVQSNGVDTSLYLTSIQAGTEVATGNNAKFTTSQYTISSS